MDKIEENKQEETQNLDEELNNLQINGTHNPRVQQIVNDLVSGKKDG